MVDLSSLDVATLAWLAGSSANNAILASLHRAGHAGVRISHGYVIQHLIEGSPTVSTLGGLLGVTQQAASKYVAELEHLGYVSRVPDRADSRVRRVELTARGRRLVADTRRIRRRLDERLPPEALVEARRALVRLLELTGGVEDVAGRRVALPD